MVFVTSVTHYVVAAELNMNPIDVMLKNDGSHGHSREHLEEFMHEYGFNDRWSLQECIDACSQTVDMRNKWHVPGVDNVLPNGKLHGIGFSVSQQWTHVLGDKGGSFFGLALNTDGTLSVMALRADQGTGHQGSVVRVAADEMGMLYEDVDWATIHEEHFFHAHDEGCSGGTIANTMSIIKAARRLKQWVLEAATFTEPNITVRSHGRTRVTESAFPDLTPDEVDIKDSMVFEKANPSNEVPLSDVTYDIYRGHLFGGEIRRPLFEWGWTRNTDPILDVIDEFPDGYPCMVRQVQFLEVEVDPETGHIDVKNCSVANDMGKAMDYDALEQQQFGGAIQGFSRSLMEEQHYDPLTGVQLNDNQAWYKIAVMNDTVHPIPYQVETGQGYGPYGATGCGETPAAAAQSLIPIALHNAIGEWVDIPCTPERVLKALGKA
jgi:xanthine dehydrogenase molybdenum-binding subunit